MNDCDGMVHLLGLSETWLNNGIPDEFLNINPIDPNPAISAHAVFPQSGHISPEKQPIFPIFHIFPKRAYKNVLTAYRGPIYQITAHEMLFKVQKN